MGKPSVTGGYRCGLNGFAQRGLPCALAAVALFGLVGCGRSSSAPAISAQQMTHPQIVPNPARHPRPDSFYVPNPIRVHVGQAVVWTNKDSDPHDVTSDDGLFASGPLAMGGSYVWVPTRPGTFRYFCTIHPEMRGEIIVTSK